MADKTPKSNEPAIYLKSAIYPSQCNFEKKNRLHFKTGACLRRGPGNEAYAHICIRRVCAYIHTRICVLGCANYACILVCIYLSCTVHYLVHNITELCMVPIFSSYPSGTILLRTKPICSKRMRRLISFSVHYMLGKRYISYTITHEHQVLFLVVEYNM